MPKAERGTPKDIANRIKAKGLQKLKWYCQMCQKQCRDENGFKCHISSDSHLRQMKIFSENSSGILDTFSKDFERMYVDTLRRRHGTSRVNANSVYQEVIQDKHHIHMNSTKWTTLTEFCQYLGKTGKCVVDETERGWYVKYIERDASILARQEQQQKRADADKREEKRIQQLMVQQRIEAAKALDRAGGVLSNEASNIEERDKSIALSLTTTTTKNSNTKSAATKKSKKKLPTKSILDDDDDEDDDDEENSDNDTERNKERDRSISRWGKKECNIDKYGEEKNVTTIGKHENNVKKRPVNDNNGDVSGEKKQSKKSKHSRDDKHNNDNIRKENWIYRDIIVRIISKKLGNGKYYKRKGIIDRVIDKFTAEIEVLNNDNDNHHHNNDIIQLDQDDLETVIPKSTDRNQTVRILNGQGRKKRAKVISLDKKNYVATLRLLDDSGRILHDVNYEDFSKVAE